MESNITSGRFTPIGNKPSNDLILSLTEIRTFIGMTDASSDSDFDMVFTIYRDEAIDFVENELMNSYILKTDVNCELYNFNNYKGLAKYTSSAYNQYNNYFFIDKANINSISEIRYTKDETVLIYDSSKYYIDRSKDAYLKVICKDSDNNYYFPSVDLNNYEGILGSVSIDFNCGLYNSDGSNVKNKIKAAILSYIKSKYESCEDNNALMNLQNQLIDLYNPLLSFI